MAFIFENLDVYKKAIDFADEVGEITKSFSRGSAFECVPILELCKRRLLINEVQHVFLKQKIEDISKMLSGLIKY